MNAIAAFLTNRNSLVLTHTLLCLEINVTVFIYICDSFVRCYPIYLIFVTSDLGGRGIVKFHFQSDSKWQTLPK